MEPVISVNLNGVAYQIEEPAYRRLRAYLEQARAALSGNPDQAEILADLEQAIGDKCRGLLGSHKTVVTAREIEQVLAEMGPVEAAPAGDARGADRDEPADSGAAAPKRLYQIREGAMISGLCQGLAAYFDIDVTIIRVAFVILAVLTKGLWLAVYGVLMFVIPYATSPEEQAAAHGQPFSAKAIVDQAKRNYARVRSDTSWQRHWRKQRRQATRHIRRQMRDQAFVWTYPEALGLTLPILNLLNAAWLFALLFALFSLFRTGTIFGWPPPVGVPVWVAAAALIVLYQFVASPLVMAHAWSRGGPGIVVRSGGLTSLVALAILGWLGYQYVPAFHGLADRALAWLQTVRVPQ